MKTFDYICRKAQPGDSVRDIAKYTHLTDPYIYPTITNDPCDPAWEALIASSLGKKDTLFSLEHFSLALRDGRIVGLACVIPCGRELSFGKTLTVPDGLREGFARADAGYFTPLIAESASFCGYNITNVCVDAAHRRKGVGTLLMQHCIEEYGHAPLHLDVIADNAAAIALYQKCGFRIASAYDGYSGSEQPLPCYHMLRDPSGGEV